MNSDGTQHRRHTAPLKRCRGLVVISKLKQEEPWWWRYISTESSAACLDYCVIPLKYGRIRRILSRGFLAFVIQIWALLRRTRGTYSYIFTFENGWDSLLISFLQGITGMREPRHVILQFIMREKTQTLASRVKYAFMRWLFSSVYLCICSSEKEGRYYESVFGWPSSKWRYVPLHTDPNLLNYDGSGHDGFVLSAGRTFRDYRTLLTAFERIDKPLRIVASPSNIDPGPKPTHVMIDYDLPGAELVKLMARAFAVVVPLEPRQISVGQSVILQAMTLGKPVIATNVNGTEDYIEHMKTGILVPPCDPGAIEEAVRLLLNDEELRQQLSRAARERIQQVHMPTHYVQNISRLLDMARQDPTSVGTVGGL